MIEIDLKKLERGTHAGIVTVRRDGKTFQRKQRLGTKEKSSFLSWKRGDPYPEGLKIGAIIDTGDRGTCKVTQFMDTAVKCGRGKTVMITDIVGIVDPGQEKAGKIGKPVKKPQSVIIHGLSKPKDEQPEKISTYTDAPGIKGSMVKYSSLPATFTLNSDVVKEMGTFRKASKKSRNEVGTGINVVRGEMKLGKMESGSTGNIIITGKTKFGSYHTHPDPAADTFSLNDVLQLISVHPINLTMAHSVRSDHLWTAVASAETREMVSKLSVKELMAMKSKYLAASSMASDGPNKNYRKFIKQFCDKYKIGLYVGKINENMEKYDGSW